MGRGRLEASARPLLWRSHGGRRPRSTPYRRSVKGERGEKGAVSYSTQRTTMKLHGYQMFKTEDPQRCEGRGTSQREKARGKRMGRVIREEGFLLPIPEAEGRTSRG